MPGQPIRGVLEADPKEGAGISPLKFHFNPKELTFSKQNSWNPSDSHKGRDVAPLEFGGGQPQQLTMQLMFDTYDGENSEDVRGKYTDKLLKMMEISEATKDQRTKKGRPPRLRLQWGTLWSFPCVIESLNIKYTLFTSDGKPVRALVDLTLKQAVDEKEREGQNPTSGSPGGRRAWITRPGDRLDWIAYKELGDAKLWRTIADENGLLDVKDLAPGRVLAIPPYVTEVRHG